MKLVTIILLLCVHSADSANREGKKGEVVFCDANDELKLDTSAGELVTWKFNGNDLPSGVTHPDASTKKDLKIATLAAANTGLYKATYNPNTVKKFTIIVDAETCTAATPCNVKVGGSIKLDGDTGVTWHFKAPNSDEIEIKDDKPNDPPKFTTNKKELGLFDLQKPQSGKYTAKKTGSNDKEFPVAVREPVTSATVKEKKRSCTDVTLVCEVTGDAKSFTWNKDNTKINGATEKEHTITNAAGSNGEYVCKAKDYFDAEKGSADFTYTYAAPQTVSDVSITKEGRRLTCVATGTVKRFEWQMEDGTTVSAQHGTVDDDVKSQLKLTLTAKGNFVCKAIGCDDKAVMSKVFVVAATTEDQTNHGGVDEDDKRDNTGLAPPTTTSKGLPGRGPQGASTSVALLLISVLVELYVMML
nr:uncharacterized protein LOC125972349 [Syngnathus scovelli]